MKILKVIDVLVKGLQTRFSTALGCAVAVLLASASVQAMELSLPQQGDDLVGEVQIHIATHEDTFADLGQTLHLGYSEMVAANPFVDAWLPGEGKEVVIPTQYILPDVERSGIVMNLAEYRLYYFPKNEAVVYTYPIGIGREGWSSPISSTSVVMKTPNPGWTPPQSILREHAEMGDPLPAYVPPGPDNPLGPYKMTLGLPGYLIHGSNKKFGIGMRVSHGCFRMLNHNVLELAKLVPVGEKVRIINEPYKLGWQGDELYLEAHQPLDDHGEPSVVDKHALVLELIHSREDVHNGARIDWNLVREVVAAESGIPGLIGQRL